MSECDDNPLLVQCMMCQKVFEAGPDNWLETGLHPCGPDEDAEAGEGEDDGGLAECEDVTEEDLEKMSEWDLQAIGLDTAARDKLLAMARGEIPEGEVSTGAAPCCDACLKEHFGEEGA